MAVISKGIALSYKKSGEASYKELTNMQEIPDLGGDKEKIEITVLKDDAHRYTEGIDNYGDSLAFKFLYETEQFSELQNLDSSVNWKVVLPDNTNCAFSGKGRVKLAGVGVNAALTYTLSITPDSEMIWG